VKIDVITIFPDMFRSVFKESIIMRAQNKKKVSISIHNLRKWSHDKHKTVDNKPFGGGAGMVMMVEPIYSALRELDQSHFAYRILFTAKGERIMQEKVRELSQKKHLILICGHYEGVDHRVHEHLVDECLSVGDFILTGGEIPAMALTDAVVRLLPGVVGNETSVIDESFSKSKKGKTYIEYPQYTRPAEFTTIEGTILKVPDILLSGDHKKVKKWREENKKMAE
jgi:tRNA (guanine37-N1)-methyltransferase